MVNDIDLTELGLKIDALIDRARDLERQHESDLELVHARFRDSAINLVHYMALRQTDLRDLQRPLASLGLSSLGMVEKNVLASLNAVREALRSLDEGVPYDVSDKLSNPIKSDECLSAHINDLLGTRIDGREVRIMVTLPTEAANEYVLVKEMISSGMDIARVNCSHDDQTVWLRMIENIRRAQSELARPCQIVMDLAGPKIRTGPVRPGPGVVRFRQKRDSLGRIKAPGRVRFVCKDARWSKLNGVVVPVPSKCIEKAQTGDTFSFKDTRGRKRVLNVVGKDDYGLILECYRNSYVATGTKFRLKRRKGRGRYHCRAGNLPPVDEPLILKPGDTLILHRDMAPGENAVFRPDGSVKKHAHIAIQPADALGFVSKGQRVFINDGKIEGIVKKVTDNELHVKIDFAKVSGSKLRAGKGVNFPDSNIGLHGLTETDAANLPFVAEHADAVSQSFVRTPADVIALQEELRKYPSRQPGIILKIETLTGFNHLPELLLRAMRHYPAGVMIARGDLAVECGWVRLVEVQEEMLWLCEAAQLPVIWATQVLERETKKGQPSRAEITDAAMSQRADCVMLNKGPHVLSAIRMLDDILRRMQSHQYKKTPTLRRLGVAEDK